MEQPVLRLGLLGFSGADMERMKRWIGLQQPGWPLWSVCDPHGADAWMICGGSVDVLGRDALVINHPLDAGQQLTLNRAEVDRPLAFSTPLPAGFASAEFFDAADETSVRQRLQRFEAWLRPLRTQFALGAQLVDRMREFPRAVVHLMQGEKLIAVIDMNRGQVGLHTPARPIDLDMVQWVPVSIPSHDIPPSFMRLSLHRVLWTFAVRTVRDVLPVRYRERMIYLRRVPRVPARWFEEMHLRFMRELMVRPGTLEEMSGRMDMSDADIERCVAALYYGGGLTTDPESARRAEPSARRALVALHFDKGSPETVVQSRSGVSELAALSSILQDARHSPLRAVVPSENGLRSMQMPY